jgi:type IV pilus assembly protein PilW
MTANPPAPFASVNPDGSRNFVLAPVLIVPGGTTPAVSGQSSDVLVVMSGAAAMSGLSVALKVSPTATSLSIDNSQAFNASDLVLLTDPDAPTQCIIVQVSATFSDTTLTSLPLAGGFFSATINSQSITNLSSDTSALPLGVPGTTSAPQFQLIGVGDNNTLFTYDLLQTSGSTQALQARASGVFEMHAIYGVDSNGDGVQDSWVSPSSGTYALSKFAAGTSDLAALIKSIKSIRVAIAMQSNESINASSSGPQSSLVFFPDLSTQGLSVTRTLSSSEQRSRYRIVDATIVLRNNQ